MSYCYEYPRPMVSVGVVLFFWNGEVFETLLIKRRFEPFKDQWAFPAGFLNEGERLEAAAMREVREETGISGVDLHQFFTYSLDDPRGHNIGVFFFGLCANKLNPSFGDDANAASWVQVDEKIELIDPHREMLDDVLDMISNNIKLESLRGE